MASWCGLNMSGRHFHLPFLYLISLIFLLIFPPCIVWITLYLFLLAHATTLFVTYVNSACSIALIHVEKAGGLGNMGEMIQTLVVGDRCRI